MIKLLNILILILSIVILNCGDEEDPRARIKNLTADTLNISLKQGTNPTVNFNNVKPDTYSRFEDIEPVYSIATGLPNKKECKFEAELGYDYTIVAMYSITYIERKIKFTFSPYKRIIVCE